MNEDENIIRKVFTSEITWIIGILTFGATFTTQVIIPINTMQIQLTSIQAQLTDYKNSNEKIATNQTNLFTRIAVIETYLQITPKFPFTGNE